MTQITGHDEEGKVRGICSHVHATRASPQAFRMLFQLVCRRVPLVVAHATCNKREKQSVARSSNSNHQAELHIQEITSDDLWNAVKTADGGDEKWYKVAVEYWDKQEASYNGVLGGYGHVSDVDLRDSRTVLLKVRSAASCLCCSNVITSDRTLPPLCRRSKPISQMRTRSLSVLWVRYMFPSSQVHCGCPTHAAICPALG